MEAVKRAPLSILLFALGLVSPATAQERKEPILPRWLHLGMELRGRYEGFTGLGYERGADDAYYLHRLRLNAAVEPNAWLRFSVEVQDSRATGRLEPLPGSVQDTFDLRGAFVELGRVDKPGWAFRAGRQALRYGAERLVGWADWGNVGRRFDAARLTYQHRKAKLDWFAATLTPRDPDGFDKFETDQKLFGFYSGFPELVPGGELQPYVFFKKTPSEEVVATGARLSGGLPSRFDYSGEIVFETGDVANESLQAWAGYAILGYTAGTGPRAPRLSVEYDYASGDANAGEGKRGTFDQLYPTNHGKYGIADRMGWRNMHGLRGGIAIPLSQRWRIQVDYHSFWLASRQDFLYWSNGSAILRNPGASSNHVHQEIDLLGVVKATAALDFFFGYAHVFPGQFLRESSPGSPVTYAYVAFRFTL